MKKYLYNFNSVLIALLIGLSACFGDLEVTPIDDDEATSGNILNSSEGYKMLLAKIYAGLSLTGQQGPAGRPDIAGIDEGFSSYLRAYWYHQELTTDEAVIAWNDQTIKDFHNHVWGANDLFIRGMYSRIYYQITLSNAFVIEARKSSDPVVAGYALEARFLRALSYWHALDLFRNVPFITDAEGIGASLPRQATPQEVFDYIESELLEIEVGMADPGNPQYYARADKGAAWMLLAKLYLNSQVYTGVQRNADALVYVNKVLNEGSYGLENNYSHLFMADNDGLSEIIFTIAHDGFAQTWGGNTFIIHAAVGGNMSAGDYGIDGGWGGTRTTRGLVDKFDGLAGDGRAMFHTSGQSLDINDVGVFTDGYAITKWKNIRADNGQPGKNLTFVDTDFPVFRLADAYLMYAELFARNTPGTNGATALDLVNALRERSFGNTDGNLSLAAEITLDFVLDERARELYWECHRRTDLIRFGVFTGGDYLWPWKGGVKDGTSTGSIYNIFPIPAADLAANPRLKQNTGY
jgi:starch-binding outer membrane protein, SusD/RagB family